MPYRIDICEPAPDALDILIQLGALDVAASNGGLAALLPDAVTPEAVSAALGGTSNVAVSAATARDDESVWLLNPMSMRIGEIVIASPEVDAAPDALRLIDSRAFGTGHHPTTALCLEAMQDIFAVHQPDSVLDVGTGSGILALAALKMGATAAVGLDIDADALNVAAQNAELNYLTHRLQLILGEAGIVSGRWPLVVANVLAAPLIDMASVLMQRLASRGQLLLSGIACSLEAEVLNTYKHFGMQAFDSRTRGGWVALTMRAPW